MTSTSSLLHAEVLPHYSNESQHFYPLMVRSKDLISKKAVNTNEFESATFYWITVPANTLSLIISWQRRAGSPHVHLKGRKHFHLVHVTYYWQNEEEPGRGSAAAQPQMRRTLVNYKFDASEKKHRQLQASSSILTLGEGVALWFTSPEPFRVGTNIQYSLPCLKNGFGFGFFNNTSEFSKSVHKYTGRERTRFGLLSPPHHQVFLQLNKS